MKRSKFNPIVSPHEIPDIAPEIVDTTSVFNPGAIKFGEKYLMMLRVQNRGRETFFVMAESNDGYDFSIKDNFIKWKNIEKVKEKIYHIYDPRITKLGDKYYIVFAMDLESGCYLGLGETNDFEEFTFIDIISQEDNRNGVLFPEKIDDFYYRLDRPNKNQLTDGPLTGSEIWLSKSKDLINWKAVKMLIRGRKAHWDELIGAGPPPIKTHKGWLQIYHGIAMHYQPIYQAGVMLLDLKNPAKVIARGRYNILEPREIYETVGQVPNVIFPTGIIPEEIDENGFVSLDSKIKIYYGAADTVIGMAETSAKELIDNCNNIIWSKK